ncbi:MAG: UMP kinase, partial [Erysipelotrichaceae bacterium]|nr:UMP kinase [Erysipelotrichaceae bacterium]
MYKRVLLKLSGEALAAPDFPFSTEVLESIGKQVKQINEMGVGVGIVVGGGNICRGRIFEDLGFDRVKADYAGMLATVINAVMFS